MKRPMRARMSVDATALIKRIAQRDRAAFGELFAAFAPRVKSYLLKLGSDAAAAEELAQEAMLSVWRRAETYDPSKGAGSTWIFVIARNCRIDALRKERLDLVYDESQGADHADESDDQHKQLSDAQIGATVRAAMAELSPEQQDVVRLSYFEDRPHSEIAASLGLPLGTVKSRLRLAMLHLRSRLEKVS